MYSIWILDGIFRVCERIGTAVLSFSILSRINMHVHILHNVAVLYVIDQN